MYSSTFIFAKGQWDGEFHRLDEEITRGWPRQRRATLARSHGENASTGLVSNVYYWQSLEALQALMSHPAHLQAKSQQAKWLAGYQVVISQVLGTYGDSRLTGLLPVVSAA